MKYNLKDLSTKIELALEKLSEEKPAIKDTGSKIDALLLSSDKLTKMMAAGYTAKQIADAIATTADIRVPTKAIAEVTGLGKPSKKKTAAVSTEPATV